MFIILIGIIGTIVALIIDHFKDVGASKHTCGECAYNIGGCSKQTRYNNRYDSYDYKSVSPDHHCGCGKFKQWTHW